MKKQCFIFLVLAFSSATALCSDECKEKTADKTQNESYTPADIALSFMVTTVMPLAKTGTPSIVYAHTFWEHTDRYGRWCCVYVPKDEHLSRFTTISWKKNDLERRSKILPSYFKRMEKNYILNDTGDSASLQITNGTAAEHEAVFAILKAKSLKVVFPEVTGEDTQNEDYLEQRYEKYEQLFSGQKKSVKK